MSIGLNVHPGTSQAIPAVSGRRSRTGRVLLFLLFLLMMIDAIPGMGVGIAPGLSAKNLYLYSLCVYIGARAVMNPSGLRFVDLAIHVPFLLLIAYALATLAVSIISDPGYATIPGGRTLKNKLIDLYLLFFVFRYLVSDREDFLWLIKSIVVFMLIASVVTLIDFLNIPDLGIIGTHRGRIEGPIGSANQYGAMLAFLLPITLATMPETGQVKRWLWRFGILISVVLLIGTGSRGAYFATIAGSVLAVYLVRRHIDMRTVVRTAAISAVVLMVLVVSYMLLNPDFLANLLEKSTTGNIETASSGRWAIWSAAFGVMLEAPLSFFVGYGWNTFDSSGIWKSAHSEYVDRFFELGIMGLLIYCSLLFMIVREFKNSLNVVDAVAHPLMRAFVFSLCILVIDIMFTMPYTAWNVIWIFIGLMLGLKDTSIAEEAPTKASVDAPPARQERSSAAYFRLRGEPT